MKDRTTPGKQYPTDERLRIQQTAEHADRIDALCEHVDKLAISVGILKWTSRITILILLALGGICWELIKTLLKYAPAIIEKLSAGSKP